MRRTAWKIGCLILTLPPIAVFALVAKYYFQVLAPGEIVFERYGKVVECFEKGQYENALKQADALVQMNERHTVSDALYLRARIHVRLGDLDAAIHDLSDVIAASEYYSHWCFARGRCYEHKGMREAAAADYSTVYNQRLDEIAQHNETNPAHPNNYLGIIQNFWTLRQDTDRDFGFELIQFQDFDSPIATRRARLNAVLTWLRQYVDVHPEIIANVDDLDAKIHELAEREKRRS